MAVALDDVRSMEREQKSPQSFAMEVLQRLYRTLDCKAVASWLAMLVQRFHTSIDDSACEWGQFDVTHTPEVHQAGPSGKRRKRLHASWKDAVALRGIQENRAHSSEGVLRAIEPNAAGHGAGLRAEAELLRHVQASAFMTFEPNLHVISVAWDGVRVGNPALELISAYFWHARHRLAVPGPPMLLKSTHI